MQLPRQTTTFSLRRTLSWYSLVMAFNYLCNLRLISYDDGLIDDGEFIVLSDLDHSILEAFDSLRRAAFVFVFKLKVYTHLKQLLTCSYAKFRLLKRIKFAMFFHIFPLSGFLIATSCSRVHWKIVAFTSG